MMEKFGKINERECNLYTVENNHCILKVTDYGATIVSFVLKDKGVDVIQGFDDVDGYVNDVPYMGGSIGRVCNRIAEGKFILNNVGYKLNINNGPNALHGGIKGFDKVIWDVEVNDDQIICKYLSRHLEEGYPGNLNVVVTYTLLSNGFRYEYEGISDQDTLFSMTNHAFFNLNGPTSDSVLDHELIIKADYIAKVDQDGQTLNELLAVKDTPFDFNHPKKIGKDIEVKHPQIINGNGYDHHYLIAGEGFRKMVECYANNIRMSVFSDLPGFHLYSGNFLNGTAKGKLNGNFPRRSAVCFESQYYPNAINYDDYEKPILYANTLRKHKTEFLFE